MREAAISILAIRRCAAQTLMALCVMLSLVTMARAQLNPGQFDLPAVEPDPLYHVELIVFAFNEGNRFEEDFLHGIENPRFAPPLKLLDVPNIELDSVFGFEDDDDTSPAETTPLPNQVEIGAESLDPATPPVAAPTDRLELIELATPSNTRQPIETIPLPDEFRLLTNDELELNNVAARMNRRPYTLLGHAGWVQTGVDSDLSVGLDLKSLGITNPTGTIEVYARRYLHAVVDFDFYDGSGAFWSAPNGFGIAPFQYAQSFKIEDEVNAIRSGDAPHYIDHPLFGVLIQIRRAPEPEDEPGSQSAEGPAG